MQQKSKQELKLTVGQLYDILHQSSCLYTNVVFNVMLLFKTCIKCTCKFEEFGPLWTS